MKIRHFWLAAFGLFLLAAGLVAQAPIASFGNATLGTNSFSGLQQAPQWSSTTNFQTVKFSGITSNDLCLSAGTSTSMGWCILPSPQNLVGQSGQMMGFASGTTASAIDTGIERISAGVIGLNNGTANTGGGLRIPALKSTTGTRFICVDTNGTMTSSASVCSGT